MPKKMLFNATEIEEVRAAIVESKELLEYDLEARSREQNRNNIYRGYIVQVEPSIQAAFVEYGTGRHGFLPFREIHPDFYSRKAKGSDRQLSIEKVIKKGQQVIVQVVREEVDHKGAALTTYCTLPGRYLVLMPRSETRGISRKIDEGKERQALREIMRNIKPPDGFGYIIRTAGLGKTEAEISRDLNIMVRLWRSIQKAAKRGPRSGLIFQDADIIQRMIRDYYEGDVDEIWIDDQEAFERAHAYFSAVMPDMENVVKFYEEDVPLFAKYKLEEQIHQIYARQVPLPSGGSIVIDTTEALVAIDVNSGKTQSDKTEDTAFKTNCEAAKEIAKQIRMRDLGGLIVIDFIGMRLTRHMRGVERAMREAIKGDKARIRLGRITSVFGLLTLSRQRIRDKKDLTHFTSCPACRGTGRYPNVETNALKAYRHLQQLVVTENYDRISASLPKEVALYLLNYKRAQLTEMEKEFDVQISVVPKDNITLDLDRDFSVQIRSKQRQSKRKRKERTPIELPYERISNQLAKKEEKLRHQAEADIEDAHEATQEATHEVEVTAEASHKQPKIDLPDPNAGHNTYYEDGWDQIAKENHTAAYPSGSLWFLRHMKEDRSGPSIGQLARRQGLQRPKRRIGLPQPGPATHGTEASHPQPQQARQQDDRKGRSEQSSRKEHKRDDNKPAKEPQEQSAKSDQGQEKRSRQDRRKDDSHKQSPGKGKSSHKADDNSDPKDAPASEGTDNQQANGQETSKRHKGKKPPRRDSRKERNSSDHEAQASNNGNNRNNGNQGETEEISHAPQADDGQDSSKERLPLPAEILAQHNAKAQPPQPQRPAAKPISYRPAPYHPLNPPKAQKPEAEGGVWSNNEMARIRRAAEAEQRRMTRWDHGNGPETTRPGGVQELRDLAESLAPSATPEVTVTAPGQESSAKAGQRKVLKRPARKATKSKPKEAAKETSEAPKPAKGGKRNRWTDEEVNLLQSLCHLPLQEAKAAFEAEGYERSLNAFRNRYYSLRSQ